MINLQQKSV
jgi:hypothetical protein